MPANPDRERLAEAVRAAVPARPGVYTWHDASGAPLYVGKAVNLRARMLSYLRPGRTARDDRYHELAYALRGFAYRETAGELLALLLEDATIKSLWPRHNERQRDFLERRYLLLTDDPFPACTVVEGAGSRPGRLYGPFKDEHLALRVLGLLTADLGLRACPDPVPYRRSARGDLGLCAAPCRGAVTPREYADRAGRAAAFLEGDGTWASEQIGARMAAAAQALDFERAAELRDRRDFCLRFAARQRFTRLFVGGEFVAHEAARSLRYRFERGALVAVEGTGGGDIPVPVELTRVPADRRLLLDRAAIVYRWQAAHPAPDLQLG